MTNTYTQQLAAAVIEAAAKKCEEHNERGYSETARRCAVLHADVIRSLDIDEIIASVPTQGADAHLTQMEKDNILHAMVEGLHAMIYGTYTIQSGDFALQALGDGGSIHEYVHHMMRLLPPRCFEQIQSGGIKETSND